MCNILKRKPNLRKDQTLKIQYTSSLAHCVLWLESVKKQRKLFRIHDILQVSWPIFLVTKCDHQFSRHTRRHKKHLAGHCASRSFPSITAEPPFDLTWHSVRKIKAGNNGTSYKNSMSQPEKPSLKSYKNHIIFYSIPRFPGENWQNPTYCWLNQVKSTFLMVASSQIPSILPDETHCFVGEIRVESLYKSPYVVVKSKINSICSLLKSKFVNIFPAWIMLALTLSGKLIFQSPNHCRICHFGS